MLEVKTDQAKQTFQPNLTDDSSKAKHACIICHSQRINFVSTISQRKVSNTEI